MTTEMRGLIDEGWTMSVDTDVMDELLALINNEVSLDPSTPVASDTDLLLTGLVDSLGVVQIVGWMEDRFGIEIEPSDVVLENFQTPQAMVDYLDRRDR